MRTKFYFPLLMLYFMCSICVGQQVRILISGSYYNDNDNVYIGCGSGGFNAQVQYNYNGNWYIASHLNVDAAPSGWNWTFQPTTQTNKTSIGFSVNYPTTSGQLVIQWNAPLVLPSSYQFHLNIYATPQLYFTSTPTISSSYSSNTYSVYAGTSGNVNWTTYGGVQVNGANTYCCGQSATVSTQAYGGLVEVTASNACGTSPAISVPVYTPFIQNTTVNGSNGSSATVSWVATLFLDTRGTATGANWNVTNGTGSISPNGTSCNAYPSNFLRIVGTPTNSNGAGQDWTFYIWKEGYSGYRMAYPNPAKDQLTLEFDDAIIPQELLSSLLLVDEKGKTWRNFNIAQAKSSKYFEQSKNVIFDVKDIPAGTYYLQIQLGEKHWQERILIQ